jgi:hypothetical protein
MKTYAIIAIALIVLGAIALAHTGITYTTRERVVDIGPVKVDKETKHTVPIEPILGGLAVVGGVVLLLAPHRHDGP